MNTKLAKKAEKILNKKGVSLDFFVNKIFEEVIEANDIPFSFNIPNKDTELTFKKTDNNKNLVKCENKEDMFLKLGL